MIEFQFHLQVILFFHGYENLFSFNVGICLISLNKIIIIIFIFISNKIDFIELVKFFLLIETTNLTFNLVPLNYSVNPRMYMMGLELVSYNYIYFHKMLEYIYTSNIYSSRIKQDNKLY